MCCGIELVLWILFSQSSEVITKPLPYVEFIFDMVVGMVAVTYVSAVIIFIMNSLITI